jgi:hypothetical protein
MVLARKEREVVVCKNENDASLRTSIEVVRAVNSALENSEIIAAWRFQSGDTLIIFNEGAKTYKIDDT